MELEWDFVYLYMYMYMHVVHMLRGWEDNAYNIVYIVISVAWEPQVHRELVHPYKTQGTQGSYNDIGRQWLKAGALPS